MPTKPRLPLGYTIKRPGAAAAPGQSKMTHHEVRAYIIGVCAGILGTLGQYAAAQESNDARLWSPLMLAAITGTILIGCIASIVDEKLRRHAAPELGDLKQNDDGTYGDMP